MRKLCLMIIIMISMLSACENDVVNVIDEPTPINEPNVSILDPEVWGYIKTVTVHKVDESILEYDVYKMINMEYVEPWYETKIEENGWQYILGWSGDYYCYRILIDNVEIDFFTGLVDDLFVIEDIKRSGLPIRVTKGDKTV